MTTIDIPQSGTERFFSANPYALPLHGEGGIVDDATRLLIASETPYIDKTTNPDISSEGADFSVYKLDSKHPLALISRAIEGAVIIDEQWEKTPEAVAAKAASYEDNSLFFLVVDTTDPVNPKAAATLRVADMLRGGSETQDFYFENYGVPIPDELSVTELDEHRGVWDVVGVMAAPECRGANGATAWAYHALYKASQDYEVHRWISNITDREFKNLDALGIPFTQVPGTDKILVERDGHKKPVSFGFYDCDVDAIRPSMEEKIGGLDVAAQENKFYGIFARLSRIALDGQFTIDFPATEAA